MDLATRLILLREAQCKTIRQMARAIGVSYQTLYGWENGQAKPNSDKIMLICKAYGVSPNELLGWQSRLEKQTILSHYISTIKDCEKELTKWRNNVERRLWFRE